LGSAHLLEFWATHAVEKCNSIKAEGLAMALFPIDLSHRQAALDAATRLAPSLSVL
jgi:hypothetical protein